MTPEALGISDIMRSSAFWVMLTMVSFLLALILHSYWTNWAHQRLDVLRKEMDDMKDECAKMNKELEALKDKNPFPWLRKVGQ